MRVIRTEVYFDEKEIRQWEGENVAGERYYHDNVRNPGIGVAFFRNYAPFEPHEVENLKEFKPISEVPPTKDYFPSFIDLFIRDADESHFRVRERPTRVVNKKLVEYILSQEIVIERSPPFSISLKGLIDSANVPVWIGTFIGIEAARWDAPALLLLTVPAGIIVVASARGIGRAMELGLNQLLKRLFNPNP